MILEQKKVAIIAAVIILIVISAILVVFRQSGNPTGFVISSPIKTCKQVEVPYEVQEAYEEQEPYQALEEYKVPLKYEVISAVKDTTLHGFDFWATSDVKVRNVDTETGAFTVTQTFTTLNGPGSTQTDTQYIMPGEVKNFHEEYNIARSEDFNVGYTVHPAVKTLTRTVTRYRAVTKYRPITKYKTEQVCS